MHAVLRTQAQHRCSARQVRGVRWSASPASSAVISQLRRLGIPLSKHIPLARLLARRGLLDHPAHLSSVVRRPPPAPLGAYPRQLPCCRARVARQRRFGGEWKGNPPVSVIPRRVRTRAHTISHRVGRPVHPAGSLSLPLGLRTAHAAPSLTVSLRLNRKH